MQILGEFMINADLIVKQLQCAICLNEVSTPALTKCGHCFCYNCIDEVINRYHKCPLCNFQLQTTDIFNNSHINTIKQIIDEQRQKKINSTLSILFGKKEENKFLPNFTLIANMFQKAVSEMYNTLESKYIEAAEEYQQRLIDIQNDYKKQLNLIKTEQEQIELQNQQQRTVEQIQLNFDQLRQYYSDCVLKSLEQFKCEQIDVLISIVLPKLKIQFAQPFKVNSKLNSVFVAIKQHLDKINDPIINENTDNLFVIFSKPQDLGKVNYLVQTDQIEQIKSNYQLYPINSDIYLVSLGQVKQGTVMVLIGNLQVKSQAPIECITYNFNKDQQVDYYSCQTCQIHWVCKNCKDYCHKDHQITIYKLKFKPDWACCYCVTKAQCKALNKNTK